LDDDSIDPADVILVPLELAPLSCLEKMAKDENERHAATLKDINELRPHLEVLQGSALLFGGTVGTRMWYTGVEWRIKVNKFHEAAPMLEHLAVCGYEEVTSTDEPYSNARRFNMVRGVSLVAELNEETQSCKKVIVGWTVHEPSPKYAFECKDDEPTTPIEPIEGRNG
jgi:hypothetical protein